METKSLLTKTCVAAALGLFSMQASATVIETVTVSAVIDANNDCAGFFNPAGTEGFGACNIQAPESDELLSPVIAKIDVDDYGTVTDRQYNEMFPTIDAKEFDISYDADTTSGSWTYTPDDAEDPGVRYWVAKASNEFTLFWTVEADMYGAAPAVCSGDAFNLDCLNLAQVVTEGTWNTTGAGLSHLTFYDTTVIPVPAAVWLFGSGLLGLVGVARRRQA